MPEVRLFDVTPKSSLFESLLAELSLRTQIRSTIRRPMERRNMSRISHEFVRNVLEAKASGKTLNFNVDPESHPPAYGEFLTLIILLRFLGEFGVSTSLNIPRVASKSKLWSNFSQDEVAQVLTQFHKMATCLLLPERSTVSEYEPGQMDIDSIRQVSTEFPSYQVTHSLLVKTSALLTPMQILRGLISPSDFRESRAIPESHPKYVTWHLRSGKWDRARDLSFSSIAKDFAQISHLRPDHEIIILSTSEHSLKVIDYLMHHQSDSIAGLAREKIKAQPKEGFLGAIETTVKGEHFFQRRGGGVGMAAVLSTTPYTIVNDHYTHYYFAEGDRIVPWATQDQVFRVNRGSRTQFAEICHLQ